MHPGLAGVPDTATYEVLIFILVLTGAGLICNLGVNIFKERKVHFLIKINVEKCPKKFCFHARSQFFANVTIFTGFPCLFHTCGSVPTSAEPPVVKKKPSTGIAVLSRGATVWRSHFFNEI